MRIRTTLKTAAVAAVLALAGCGGTPAPATGAPHVTASAPPAAWPSARTVAAQADATGIQPATPDLYASDEVTATLHGRAVTVATFASGTLRDNWEKIASQFTPVVADGPQWAITDNGPAS